MKKTSFEHDIAEIFIHFLFTKRELTNLNKFKNKDSTAYA